MPSNIDDIQSLSIWEPAHNADELISNGLLSPGSRMIYFGGPKSWKTILAQHTAFCLATGRDWLGFHTRICIPFKLQVELPKAIEKKRVLKYSNAMLQLTGRPDLASPPNMYFRTDNYIKLDTPAGVKSLEQNLDLISRRYPHNTIVLILDPVYKLITGHIEDSYDVQRLLDHLDLMMGQFNLAIILVHHARKSRISNDGSIVDLGAEESTGSRYLANWCDTMIQLRLVNPRESQVEVMLNFVHTRNAEEDLPNIKVKWERSTLLPTILSTDFHISETALDIRDLD